MARTLLTLLLMYTSSRVTAAEDLSVVTPESVGFSADKLNGIDDTVTRLVEENRLPGAVVLVARHGRIAYLRAFGCQDLEAQTPMRTDSLFRAYSMTKAVTSAAVMMLADDGLIDPDAAVSEYLPEFADGQVWSESGLRPPSRPPTVRDLLRHTAGLTYGVFGDSPVDQQYRAAGVMAPGDTLEKFSAKVGSLPLEYDPGTAWKYSVATDVLARVAEVASGLKFSELLRQRIFEPLKMHDTGFYVPKEKLGRFTTNYNSDGNGTLVPIDLPQGQFSSPKPFESGGGGLVSTAPDYFRFLNMIRSGGMVGDRRLLSEQSIRLMTTNQLPEEAGWVRFGDEVRQGVGFGLGFSVRAAMSNWDTGGRIGEYGWGGAASTHYWVSPNDDLIVITMEQVMPYSFMTEFALKKLIYDSITE